MANDRHLENRLSPYFSKVSSDFDKILYAVADWWQTGGTITKRVTKI